MKIGIIGSGIIGKTWVSMFLSKNYEVYLFDVDPGQISKALESLQNPDNLYKCEDLKQICNTCEYVQECVPEDLELKRKVFRLFDETVGSKKISSKEGVPIFATSSSGIPSSQIVEGLSIREHCLVAHPINPPNLISLVEIVPNPWTTQETVDKCAQIMLDLGQKPVTLKKETNGFALNRIQYQVLSECFKLVEEGVLEPEDVDTVMVEGLSPRWSFMGPFQTIDLNAPGGMKDYCDRYLDNICQITQTEKPDKETLEKLEKSQRDKYPVDKIPEVVQWRNNKLEQFKQFKNKEKLIEEVNFEI